MVCKQTNMHTHIIIILKISHLYVSLSLGVAGG